MSKLKRFDLKKDNFLPRLAVMLVLPAMMVGSLSLKAYADTTYKITDGDQVFYHTTEQTDPVEILTEAGVALGVNDTYTQDDGSMITEINIQRVQMITIDNGGQILTTGTYGETVGELLTRLDMELDEDDEISVALTDETFDGMEITISRVSTVVETYSEAIAFKTEYVDDDSIPEGQKKVKKSGKDGEIVYTAEVTYKNGEEVSRNILASSVTVEPVNKVVAVGTKVIKKGDLYIGNGVIITPDGETYTYTSTRQVKATAYTHTDAGCDMITATGTKVHWGTVAVDPKVIPYGTRMFIVSNDGQYVYGLSTAEDCGGSIKGNRVDLYMPTTKQCYAFGVRNCTIYFLG